MKDSAHHIRHIQKKVIQEARKKNLDKKITQPSYSLNYQNFGNEKSDLKTVS